MVAGENQKNKQVNERELAIGMHEINCMFCLSMTKIVSFFILPVGIFFPFSRFRAKAEEHFKIQNMMYNLRS